MPDLVTTIERQIRARADELKPSVREYEALERAKEALDATVGSPPRTTRATARPRRVARGESVTRGERSKTVLALLGGNPEITPANVALLLDISTQNAHGTIARLRKQGKVDKKDGRWVVATPT